MIIYKLIEINPSLEPSFTLEGFSYVRTATEGLASDILQVESNQLIANIIRIITIPIIGGLFYSAIKRKFDRRFN
jgi:predicted CDP-diglyceride synthetase/phosphatidate cytidylyltransferase